MNKDAHKIKSSQYGTAQEYFDLVQSYVTQNIPVEAFEKSFFEKFLNEPIGMHKKLFGILNDLFLDIDAYSPLWTEEDESLTRITENTLRKEAELAVNQLQEFMSHATRD